MANIKCKHCGAAIDSFARSCEYCGMRVETSGNSAQDFVNGAFDSVNKATKKVDKVMSDDAGQDKIYGVLAYLGLLWFVPFFLRKDSQFVRFHLNQGLILLICNVATSLIVQICSSLGLEFMSFLSILNLVWFAFAILGIVHAVQGNDETELPIVGQFRILK